MVTCMAFWLLPDLSVKGKQDLELLNWNLSRGEYFWYTWIILLSVFYVCIAAKILNPRSSYWNSKFIGGFAQWTPIKALSYPRPTGDGALRAIFVKTFRINFETWSLRSFWKFHQCFTFILSHSWKFQCLTQ